MKKRRRIEVLIERRELSIFGVSPDGAEAKMGGFTDDADVGGVAQSPEQSVEQRPARCPTCGSTEMLRLSEAMTLVARDPVRTGWSTERSHVHFTFSASEECWVCKPSLHLS